MVGVQEIIKEAALNQTKPRRAKMTQGEYSSIKVCDKPQVSDTRIYYMGKPMEGQVLEISHFEMTVMYEELPMNITYNHIEAREYLKLKGQMYKLFDRLDK